MAFSYVIRTDAGYKNNESTHYYQIRSRGKTIKSKRFNSHASSAIEAEILSVTTALQYAVEHDLRGGVMLRTDCLNLVNMVNCRTVDLDKYIKKNVKVKGINTVLLKQDIIHLRKIKDKVKAQIKHIPRERNNFADAECRKAKIRKKISGFRFRNYKGYGVAEC